MKKTFRFALTALLVGGLSLAATSCKDDDKDNGNGNGEQTAEEIAAEDANTFWAVAANLVSPFDVTTEYENKTFEPTIGSPSMRTRRLSPPSARRLTATAPSAWCPRATCRLLPNALPT